MLYAAISRWQHTPDGQAARAQRRLTDQALQLPTTLVHKNGILIPQLPFTIAAAHGI